MIAGSVTTNAMRRFMQPRLRVIFWVFLDAGLIKNIVISD
jgi:hypothetical protein